MKLAIFGATGKVGRHLLDQALAEGHEVTAFVRDPNKLGKPRENMIVKQGDVLDPEAVRDAVQGQESVLCVLGMPLMNKDGLRAKGTEIIIEAMEEAGIKRLVCLSGLGTGDSWAVLPLHYKYIIFPLMMRRVYADHERQEVFVRSSDLDWVIVRPGNLTKGPKTGQYRHGFTANDAAPKLKISFADVADFILKQSNDDTYIRQAPSLSY